MTGLHVGEDDDPSHEEVGSRRGVVPSRIEDVGQLTTWISEDDPPGACLSAVSNRAGWAITDGGVSGRCPMR